MKCKFISDHILKDIIGDTSSLELSTILRCKRSGFKKTLQNLFSRAIDEIKSKRNRETYDCKHKTELPGDLSLQEQSPLSSDLVLNAAHVNSANAYAYYLTLFNRSSLDGNGMTIKSSAHYGTNYNNAFWNGEEMVYGDGDGSFFREMTRGLDVCVHEISHAVTQFTCKLVYYAQPGALNESFSDMMGIACKHWVNKQFEPEKANWLMGDEIVGTDFPGVAIRSFKDEKAYKGDNQPKHMKNYKWTLQDNMGVHTNSGIPNHFFYQLCLIMNRPSYDRPAQIVYKAHTEYVGSTTGFKDYAKATYKAAQTLYGEPEMQAVKKAWQNVGINI